MMPGSGLEGLIGRSFAGYRLIQALGSDGVSGAFLGQRESNSPADGLPEQARIKILNPPMRVPLASADDLRVYRQRFLREAEMLRGLQGPHILVVLAVGVDELTGLPYLVSPFVNGGTLVERLARGPLPLDVASRYFAQLAEALDAAHGRWISHGDVNPTTILFDQQDQLFLADFGLTRLLRVPTSIEAPGQMAALWTRRYLAPEELRGEQAGAPADVYNAGLILYQMVTGQLPYQAQSPLDLLYQMTHHAPASPRLFRPDLPQPAEAAILRALANNPAMRPDSVGQLNHAFTLGLSGQWSDDLRMPPGTP